MLGLARASQYAGWWTGVPTFVSRSESDLAVRGSYLDTVSLTANPFGVAPATRTFDNTGITNGAKGTTVITFKYQAMSNYTWTTDAFRSGYQAIQNGPSTTDQFATVSYGISYPSTFASFTIKPARTTTTNYLSFFVSFNGYDYATLTGNLPWDSYADRWMTLIVSYSSSSGDFANWTGTTGGSNYYQRMVLQDAATGELLSQTDFRYSAFQGYDTNWANSTIAWNSATPSAGNINVSVDTTASGGQFSVDKWLIAASWMCQGEVIDPMATVNDVELRQYFVGQCFPQTVNGVKAWFNWTVFDTAVDGANTNVTLLLPSRATQTSDYVLSATTTNLTTPITDASIP